MNERRGKNPGAPSRTESTLVRGKPVAPIGMPETEGCLPVGRNPAPGARSPRASTWLPGAGRMSASPSSSSKRQQGDVSILFVFLVLAMLALGALVITSLTLATIRSTRDVTESAQAFYAADSAIEEGSDAYNWSPDLANPVCLNKTGSIVGRANYTLNVHGAGQTTPAGCATAESVLNEQAALCMEATGTTRAGSTLRRVTNDSFVSGTSFTCR